METVCKCRCGKRLIILHKYDNKTKDGDGCSIPKEFTTVKAHNCSHSSVLKWAESRYNDEVKDRPGINVHKETLHTTWMQIINYLKKQSQ